MLEKATHYLIFCIIVCTASVRANTHYSLNGIMYFNQDDMMHAYDALLTQLPQDNQHVTINKLSDSYSTQNYNLLRATIPKQKESLYENSLDTYLAIGGVGLVALVLMRWENTPPVNLRRNIQDIDPVLLEGMGTFANDCSICLGDFIGSRPLSHLVCEHTFHTECITAWLVESFICPVCRCTNLYQN